MPVTVRATIRITVDQGAAGQLGVQVARRKVTDTTRRVLNRGTILTPVRSGNLRSKNNSRVQQTGLRVVGTVFNQVNYAAAVHDGTKAHTIRPRNKKVLKFLVDGEAVYARVVNHPGTKAQPWLLRALEEIAGPEGYQITTSSS